MSEGISWRRDILQRIRLSFPDCWEHLGPTGLVKGQPGWQIQTTGGAGEVIERLERLAHDLQDCANAIRHSIGQPQEESL